METWQIVIIICSIISYLGCFVVLGVLGYQYWQKRKFMNKYREMGELWAEEIEVVFSDTIDESTYEILSSSESSKLVRDKNTQKKYLVLPLSKEDE